MDKWKKLSSEDVIDKTVESLKRNGFNASVVSSSSEAESKALALIPKGAEVMNMTSVTMDSIGLSRELNESGNYNSVKNKLTSMDRATDSLAMQKLGAAPEWAVGSVHAVTQDGQIIIASNSGSQIPGYAYGSPNVIWLVGTQKIVKDLDEGMKRIYEYVLPLESDRAKRAYGVPGSNVSKVLVLNKEVNPSRVNLIFIKEAIGF